MNYFLAGCIFWGIILCALFAVRPGSRLNTVTLQAVGLKERGAVALVLLLTVLLCTLPMGLCPTWNGENPEHRNQYEVLTESILDGRIDLDYGDMDPKLLEMENPYDYMLRTELDVQYHYDHAFYNGKYYMYFGVAPVFLLFLPFRLVTGMPLTTFHATQVFTALFIAGIFALFFLLAKKFFQALPLAVYLSLSAAVSAMSVWYIAAAPALYCTAIAAGICVEIWSLFFFAKAVWDSDGGRKSTIYGTLGSLFGALAFGCRPTVALANLLALPMFFHYIKGKKPDLKLVKQILAVIFPYIVIGALLMSYNYVRFENPFEFGQSFQLTRADQSGYGSIVSQFGPIKVADGVLQNFIASAPLGYTFPYISACSVFFNFPICLIAHFFLLQKDSLSLIRKKKLTAFLAVLFFLPVLITIMQILMSPDLLERYRSDIYWLAGILVYFAFGIFLETIEGRSRKIAGFCFSLMGFATVFSSFLLWTVPHDRNYTELYPETLTVLEKIIFLGFR